MPRVRILFVCTANVDRRPPAEIALRALCPGVHETRSAGTSAGAARRLSGEDLDWADLVVVMEERHRELIRARWPERAASARVLGIPDRDARDDPALRSVLEARLPDLLAGFEVV
jgi:predicted protein tyrosine phosphatase